MLKAYLFSTALQVTTAMIQSVVVLVIISDGELLHAQHELIAELIIL